MIGKKLENWKVEIFLLQIMLLKVILKLTKTRKKKFLIE